MLRKIKDILNEAEEMAVSKNFYYERHICKVKNENIKIQLEYSVKKDDADKFIKFGLCPYCKTLFFHEDFESKSF